MGAQGRVRDATGQRRPTCSRWNTDKAYLTELGRWGLPTVPTRRRARRRPIWSSGWHTGPVPAVLKPQSRRRPGLRRASDRSTPVPDVASPVVVQPLVDSQSEPPAEVSVLRAERPRRRLQVVKLRSPDESRRSRASQRVGRVTRRTRRARLAERAIAVTGGHCQTPVPVRPRRHARHRRRLGGQRAARSPSRVSTSRSTRASARPTSRRHRGRRADARPQAIVGLTPDGPADSRRGADHLGARSDLARSCRDRPDGTTGRCRATARSPSGTVMRPRA